MKQRLHKDNEHKRWKFTLQIISCCNIWIQRKRDSTKFQNTKKKKTLIIHNTFIVKAWCTYNCCPFFPVIAAREKNKKTSEKQIMFTDNRVKREENRELKLKMRGEQKLGLMSTREESSWMYFSDSLIILSASAGKYDTIRLL